MYHSISQPVATVYFPSNLFRLGLKYIRAGRKLSFAVVRAESDFKSEVLAGEVIFLQTGFQEIGGKSLTFRHRLLRIEENIVAFETDDMNTGEANTRQESKEPRDSVHSGRNGETQRR